LLNPADPEVFHRCKLNFEERETHRHLYDLHIDLLKLRREDPVFRLQCSDRLDTARLSADCLAVRYFSAVGQDRILLVNFGHDLTLSPIAEPLLAPPIDSQWKMLWNSNLSRYGGPGITPVETKNGWFISGETAVVLSATAANHTA
jgi:maltooligosyltrehalose trehalohydrolase